MKRIEGSVSDFIQDVAGDSPVPGGGSVAALAGALGAALAAMTARLTVGKKKYESSRENMERTVREVEPLISRFSDLVDADTEAYTRVVEALKLPRDTDKDKTRRTAALQEAFRCAASVPLETLKCADRLVSHLKTVVEQGNRNCISDAGTAVLLARTAAIAAAHNVRVNLGSIEDRDFVNRFRRETETLAARVAAAAEDLEKRVASEVKKISGTDGVS